MSGLQGAQPGPAVWPHLSHVIRCLVAADPSAIWLDGLRVRGASQPAPCAACVCPAGEMKGFQGCLLSKGGQRERISFRRAFVFAIAAL